MRRRETEHAPGKSPPPNDVRDRPDGSDHLEQRLDEALEETFPASDPIAAWAVRTTDAKFVRPGKAVDVEVHPWLPQGNVAIVSDTLPLPTIMPERPQNRMPGGRTGRPVLAPAGGLWR